MKHVLMDGTVLSAPVVTKAVPGIVSVYCLAAQIALHLFKINNTYDNNNNNNRTYNHRCVTSYYCNCCRYCAFCVASYGGCWCSHIYEETKNLPSHTSSPVSIGSCCIQGINGSIQDSTATYASILNNCYINQDDMTTNSAIVYNIDWCCYYTVHVFLIINFVIVCDHFDLYMMFFQLFVHMYCHWRFSYP